MNERKLKDLLQEVKEGGCSVEDALLSLKRLDVDRLDFACLDNHRKLRTGMPEVVYGENKTAEQIRQIMAAMMAGDGPVMATRVSQEKAIEVQSVLPELQYHEQARMLVGKPRLAAENRRGDIAILAAGTSDVPVAEEVRVTAAGLGNRVQHAYDIGVAGIHRLFGAKEIIYGASVLIVVAGMEGALPSVVSGLVDVPVIAVPTSVGYGTGLGGFAALLGMLNSCAPGMAVVNIDNGFGAACMATTINRL